MKPRKTEIQRRVMFVALAPVVVTALALALYFTLLRYGDVESSLTQRGITMARQLAPVTQYELFSGNTAELHRLAAAIAREPDVSAITFYDRDGTILAAAGHAYGTLPPGGLSDGWSGRSKDGRTLLFHAKVFSPALPLDDVYGAPAPAQRPALLLGSLTVELSRAAVVARKQEILLFTLLAALLILIAAALLARRLGRDITQPIMALEDTVQRIRDGLLATRVQPHPAGTLRALEEGINDMIAALERAHSHSSAALASSKAELHEQYEFANALVDAQANAGVGMMILDQGRVVFANDAALMAFGHAREEIRHLPAFTDLVATEYRDEWQRQMMRLTNDARPSVLGELGVLTSSGAQKSVEFAAFEVQRGEVRQIILLLTDITQRKRDSEQLAAAYAQLQIQKEEAERANTAKSRFLAAASHDLRQPLHALSLFVAGLRAQTTTREQARLASQIHNATKAMSELLEALLVISKLDLNNPVPEHCPVAIGPLLEQAVATHKQIADSKQLRLTSAPTPLWGDSDPRYLARIIDNLVANAIRYTDKGRIHLEARRFGETVRIEISDTGIGIEEKHLPHLFEEFFQVANPERDVSKGLGLGLAIVDRLAKTMGHPVHVFSHVGEGSRFCITLPLAAAQPPAPEPPPLGNFGVHILLVDEDAEARTRLADLLVNWGCVVAESAGDSPLLAPDSIPDAIISDRDCLDRVADVLRSMDAGATRVIILGDTPTHETSGPAFVSGYLGKPVKPAQLRALLQHLLETA